MPRTKKKLEITSDYIHSANQALMDDLKRECDALAAALQRRRRLRGSGPDLDVLVHRVANFEVAVPSWGLGTGGTRFGRFPGPGEPGTVFERLEDAATIHRLAGGSPAVSLHIPWDEAAPKDLTECARGHGLRFDAMNSNTFQDQRGQALSYKFGSLSHPDPAVRRQAIEHNLEVIALGRGIGSRALTVWIGDGSDVPGQANFQRSLERVTDSLAAIYRRLPPSFQLFVEYKPYEPAFYSTVIQDWGTALLVCQELGERARVLVDLGHHLPGTNIEQIVSRLLGVARLGGFHLNDSKYGDDDLTAGSIRPYQLFLIFCELVQAEVGAGAGGHRHRPSYMIDQSHNTKDPMEALMATVEEARRAYAKALLVDWARLQEHQDSCDPLMAELELKAAFETDVRPILALARVRSGAAIDPISVFRSSGYRTAKAKERKNDSRTGAGIV